MTLAEQHQAAHQTGGTRTPEPAAQSGPGLLDMARMVRA
jgi:hypothetical protein